nr:MAG TPA: hypothetical protein [Caudoviricetes sp.]
MQPRGVEAARRDAFFLPWERPTRPGACLQPLGMAGVLRRNPSKSPFSSEADAKQKAPSEGRLRAEDSPKGSVGAKPALAGRQKRGARRRRADKRRAASGAGRNRCGTCGAAEKKLREDRR